MKHFMCLAVYEQMETIEHCYTTSEDIVRMQLSKKWWSIPADRWSITELSTDTPNELETMLRTRRWDRQ